MKTKRGAMIGGIVAALLIAGLAGCGSNNAGGSENAGGSGASESVSSAGNTESVSSAGNTENAGSADGTENAGSTDGTENAGGAGSEAGETQGVLDMKGTWRVYARGDELPADEQMVFDGEKAADYRDGKTEPYVSSAYKMEGDLLKLPDISKEFKVVVLSENSILLAESETMQWKLIRVAGVDGKIAEVAAKDLPGEYIVYSVGGEKKNNETMKFDEASFTDYREEKEYLSSAYELSGRKLTAKDINKHFEVYITGSQMFFVDLDEGYVWELHKKN